MSRSSYRLFSYLFDGQRIVPLHDEGVRSVVLFCVGCAGGPKIMTSTHDVNTVTDVKRASEEVTVVHTTPATITAGYHREAVWPSGEALGC